jgi:hypothetical protein
MLHVMSFAMERNKKENITSDELIGTKVKQVVIRQMLWQTNTSKHIISYPKRLLLCGIFTNYEAMDGWTVIRFVNYQVKRYGC